MNAPDARIAAPHKDDFNTFDIEWYVCVAYFVCKLPQRKRPPATRRRADVESPRRFAAARRAATPAPVVFRRRRKPPRRRSRRSAQPTPPFRETTATMADETESAYGAYVLTATVSVMTSLRDRLLADPNAAKVHRAGTHRIATPEQTLARLEPLLPVMGVTRLADVTGLDVVGVPVVMGVRPNSRSVAVSQGKGATLAAAKASAAMEAVEGFHAERINHPLKYGSWEDMRWTHATVDVYKLPRNAGGGFHPNAPFLWIEGDELTGGGRVWAPFQLVHLNYALPLPGGEGLFAAGSNGLASGNSLLEAVCHGLSEVIERDAATLWRLAGEETQDAGRIDPDGVDDPVCRSLLDRFAAAGTAVGVWDATSDLGVPVFVVRIAPMEEAPAYAVRPASGMGCHPCRNIALSRALTEAAQSRLTFISGARDDMPRDEYERHLDVEHMAAWRARILGGRGTRRFADVPSWDAASLADDLSEMLSRLSAAGIEQVVVVDLTRPEFGVPVARVLVPGLEGLADRPDYLLGDRAQRLIARTGNSAKEAAP